MSQAVSSRRFAIASIIVACLASVLCAQTSPPPSTQNAITGKLAAIEQEVNRRRPIDAPAADALARELERVRAIAAGKDSGEPRLHVVGMYEPGHWRTNEVVSITETAHRVVLALCAYEPVRWEIKLAEGVKLQRVLIGGHHTQTVIWSDPARAVDVDMHTSEGREGNAFYAYQPAEAGDDEEGHYAALRQTLKDLTGMDVATFQGRYRGGHGPITVGREDAEYARLLIRNDLEPLYREATAMQRVRPTTQASGERFTALYFGDDAAIPAGRRRLPIGRPGVLAEFTVDGPIKGTFSPMPRDAAHVAIEPAVAPATAPADTPKPAPNICYALSSHQAYRVDRTTAKTLGLPIQGDVPRMSWLCGAAFDAKRKRLVVASLGGVGYLCAYTPEQERWSFLAEMNNVDLDGLVYSSKDDCLYGLEVRRGDGSPVVRRYSPDGVPQGAPVTVAAKLQGPGGPIARRQFALVGENVAILVPGGTEPPQCILVDPGSGQIVRTTTMSAHVPPADDFRAAEADPLWRVLGSEDTAEVRRAADRLCAGRDRSVEALRARFTQPSVQPNAERVAQFIQQLNDAQVDNREQATCDLICAGPAALKGVKDESLSAETRTRLEVIRHATEPAIRERRDIAVIGVLREIATPAAVEQLIKMSARADDPKVTTAAKRALRDVD